MSFEQNVKILEASKKIINQHLFERTVVLAAYNKNGIFNHGTGILVEVQGRKLVITAAHVVKGIDPAAIQLITTEFPSNVRFEPRSGDLQGGDVGEELDVAFLYIDDAATPLLSAKRFVRLEDMELFPTGLKTDLAILFGMPGTEHEKPAKNVDVFKTFTYMTFFPDDANRRKSQTAVQPPVMYYDEFFPVDSVENTPDEESVLLTVNYDQMVKDVFTGEAMELPDPHGMSGGGIWRTRFANSTIWTPANLHLVGIMTEFDEERRELRANRLENLYNLLSKHFALPGKE